MRVHWDRIGRLTVPLAIAFGVAILLQELFDLSRAWAVPAGLWIAVQYNNVKNAKASAAAAAGEKKE